MKGVRQVQETEYSREHLDGNVVEWIGTHSDVTAITTKITASGTTEELNPLYISLMRDILNDNDELLLDPETKQKWDNFVAYENGATNPSQQAVLLDKLFHNLYIGS